jgi:hypothetical protein
MRDMNGPLVSGNQEKAMFTPILRHAIGVFPDSGGAV